MEKIDNVLSMTEAETRREDEMSTTFTALVHADDIYTFLTYLRKNSTIPAQAYFVVSSYSYEDTEETILDEIVSFQDISDGPSSRQTFERRRLEKDKNGEFVLISERAIEREEFYSFITSGIPIFTDTSQRVIVFPEPNSMLTFDIKCGRLFVESHGMTREGFENYLNNVPGHSGIVDEVSENLLETRIVEEQEGSLSS